MIRTQLHGRPSDKTLGSLVEYICNMSQSLLWSTISTLWILLNHSYRNIILHLINSITSELMTILVQHYSYIRTHIYDVLWHTSVINLIQLQHIIMLEKQCPSSTATSKLLTSSFAICSFQLKTVYWFCKKLHQSLASLPWVSFSISILSLFSFIN